MATPAKQTLPYEELLQQAQRLLTVYPQECRNIHIDALDVYREQVDGANWDVTHIRTSGTDHDWADCRGKLEAGLRNLRASYDVDAP